MNEEQRTKPSDSQGGKVQSLQRQLRKLQERFADLEKRLQKQEQRAAPPQVKEPQQSSALDSSDWKISWKGTLVIENPRRNLRFTFGGRIHAEATWFEEDRGIRHSSIGPQSDGFEIHRARILLTGHLGKHIEFQTQYEFEGGDTDFRNLWLGYRNLPYVGRIRVGQQKEPFSLVQQGNTNHTPFIERASTASLNRLRNTGLTLHNHYQGRITWTAGIFRFSDDFGNSRNQGPGDYNFTARVTGTPINHDFGKSLLHLGLGYSFRDPVKRTMRFRSRPRSFLAGRFVDTRPFRAKNSQLFGTEMAFVINSFSMQSEFVYSYVDGLGGTKEHFKAWYIEAMWFPTGEHRNYNGKNGAFGQTKVLKPLDFERQQYGGLELGIRYSFIDLNSGPIRGGQLADLTFCANWYLYRGVRIMFNYVHANRYGLGDADIFITRFQIAW